MTRIVDGQSNHKQDILGVCIYAGSGFGLSLGILFGAAFESSMYVIAGFGFGTLLGLAIGKSLEEVQE
jgi:hypothetical protein